MNDKRYIDAWSPEAKPIIDAWLKELEAHWVQEHAGEPDAISDLADKLMQEKEA